MNKKYFLYALMFLGGVIVLWLGRAPAPDHGTPEALTHNEVPAPVPTGAPLSSGIMEPASALDDSPAEEPADPRDVLIEAVRRGDHDGFVSSLKGLQSNYAWADLLPYVFAALNEATNSEAEDLLYRIGYRIGAPSQNILFLDIMPVMLERGVGFDRQTFMAKWKDRIEPFLYDPAHDGVEVVAFARSLAYQNPESAMNWLLLETEATPKHPEMIAGVFGILGRGYPEYGYAMLQDERVLHRLLDTDTPDTEAWDRCYASYIPGLLSYETYRSELGLAFTKQLRNSLEIISSRDIYAELSEMVYRLEIYQTEKYALPPEERY